MKNVQPGDQPDAEGSKWNNANETERLPAAAVADKPITVTGGGFSCVPASQGFWLLTK